mmetsp:Transcript_5408/g.15475  ORF Transcript_5408/g.15475 Transcript_5408/m.15475 type:complete len:501 (-) Transcript_5408:91-1593(-)
MRKFHTVLFLSLWCHAAARPGGAVLSVTSPTHLKSTNFAYWALFGPVLESSQTLTFSGRLPPDVKDGCAPYPKVPELQNEVAFAAVVRRGNCTFFEKAVLAQQSGMKALVVVNSADDLVVMQKQTDEAAPEVNIFVVEVLHTFGEELITAAQEGESVVFSLETYEVSYLDISELILISLATCTAALGAWFGTSDLRHGSVLAPRRHEVVELDSGMAAGFCVGGSVTLVILFFLMKYLVYVVIASFVIGGFSCFTQLGSMFLESRFPDTKRHVFTIPNYTAVALSDVIAAVASFILVMVWLVWRNETFIWPVQDIIGVGFLCMIQRTLRLPSLQLATLLLGGMFFYDIFWVFLSPLLFQGKSVMVEVAKGGGSGEVIPMLFRIPSFGDPFHGVRMLGFGDVALPGLLVSYLRRFDLIHRKPISQGYFVPVLIGYFFGLVLTIIALSVMKMGQPALLYLVPMTLIPTVVLARGRGDLAALWYGSATSLDPGPTELSGSCDDP